MGPSRAAKEGDKILIIAAFKCFAAMKATEFQPLFKSLSDALVPVR